MIRRKRILVGAFGATIVSFCATSALLFTSTPAEASAPKWVSAHACSPRFDADLQDIKYTWGIEALNHDDPQVQCPLINDEPGLDWEWVWVAVRNWSTADSDGPRCEVYGYSSDGSSRDWTGKKSYTGFGSDYIKFTNSDLAGLSYTSYMSVWCQMEGQYDRIVGLYYGQS